MAQGIRMDSRRFQEQLADLEVIAVVALDNAADAAPLAGALASGGLGCVEITFRTPAAVDAIAAMSDRGVVMVGAGTVTSVMQVDAAVQAGASFVVAPGFDEGVAARCLELDVPYLPGVATATEIMRVRSAGCGVAKLFPAEPLGGLAILNALAAPFPDMRFVPTGGIDRERAALYLTHPAVLAVGGSWMVPRAALARRDWALIRDAASTARPGNSASR